MALMDQETLAKIRVALGQWEAAVKRASLKPTSQAAYISHPRRFVKWLASEYEPPRAR